MTAKKTVMSGMRPTGRMHLGNYWGPFVNWIPMQDQYQCFYAVADWHMLTTGYEDTGRLQDDIREMVLDWLAAGLDPEKSVIFKQSSVPEHAELTLLLSMTTPLSWLENNPTWKEQLQELAKTKHSRELSAGREEALAGNPGLEKEGVRESLSEAAGEQALRTHGFLGYPVLQAADILLYRAELVPIGQDQAAHLELSREIARRFNTLYASPDRPVLVEPQPLLSRTPKLLGLDGRKMSKSYGNTVDILETAESLSAKVMSMYTDPNKLHKNDLGHPDPCAKNPPGCVVYSLHRLYSGYWEKRGEECRGGQIGCVACKKDLLKSMEGPFSEFRQARERLAGKQGLADEVLAVGREKARAVAERTMDSVRSAMRLT